MAANMTTRSLSKGQGWEEEGPASPFPLEGHGRDGIHKERKKKTEISTEWELWPEYVWDLVAAFFG